MCQDISKKSITCSYPVISMAKAQLTMSTWHGLLLDAPYLSKVNWCCCQSQALHLDHLEVRGVGRPHEHSRPPLVFIGVLHVTFLQFCVWNQRLLFSSLHTLAQSVLNCCNSQTRLRGFEAVHLWSHISTFKIHLKSQISNLFEMSNILNLFEMSNIWNRPCYLPPLLSEIRDHFLIAS